MTGHLNETHHLLRDSVRRFVEREIIPFINDWEEKNEFPRNLYNKAAEQGILGIGFDPAYGGLESDIFHRIIAAEELLRCGSQGLVGGLLSHNIGLSPVQAMGNEEQKRRFMPPVLSGEKISALGITEPDAGSDVANLKTRAVRDGDFYVVNGSKTFITSGRRADFLTTAVRTGGLGPDGISLLVIEKDLPGYRVGRDLKKMGWRASDTAEIFFEDCRVPVSNLLGEENKGFWGVMRNFEAERLFLSVMAYATAQLAFDMAIDYARSRIAFGKPLMAKQVIRHKLADMATRIAVARDYVAGVALKMQEGKPVVLEAAMAKNFAVDAGLFVVDAAVQIHGGMGYMRECSVERLYRDMRLLSIGGGTTEIMKEIISKGMGFDG